MTIQQSDPTFPDLESEVKFFIAALHSPNKEIREYAVESLQEIGAPAVEQLLFAVFDSKSEVRSSAIRVLSKQAAQNDIVAIMIVGSLDDPDPTVRQAASESISASASTGKDWGPTTYNKLTELLHRGLDNEVRSSAARALGSIGERRIKLLRESRCNVSDDEAQHTTFRARDPIRFITQPLLDVLGDASESVPVRRSAAQALRDIGDPLTLSELKQIQEQIPWQESSAYADLFAVVGFAIDAAEMKAQNSSPEDSLEVS